MASRKERTKAAKGRKKQMGKKKLETGFEPDVKIMRLLKGASSQVPERIVLHSMSEYIDGLHAVDFLKNIGLSVHAMITPDGKIIRCRNDNEGAYHAKGNNTNTLGVEFLVKGEHTYSSFLSAIHKTDYICEEQYRIGTWFIREWLSKHDISGVFTHRFLSPGRKFDPGPGFPLNQFEKDIGVKINDIG